MGKLSDILQDSDGFRKNWESTQAAADFAPLPKADYDVRVLSGELFNSKRKGTGGYKLTMEITTGEYEGRRLWHDLWLTPAAAPMTKRDLSKIGITSLEQLEQPLPLGILLRVRVVLHTDDDGREQNKITKIDYLGIEPGDAFEPEAEAVAAKDTTAEDVFAPTATATAPHTPHRNGTVPVASSGPYGGDRR